MGESRTNGKPEVILLEILAKDGAQELVHVANHLLEKISIGEDRALNGLQMKVFSPKTEVSSQRTISRLQGFNQWSREALKQGMTEELSKVKEDPIAVVMIRDNGLGSRVRQEARVLAFKAGSQETLESILRFGLNPGRQGVEPNTKGVAVS